MGQPSWESCGSRQGLADFPGVVLGILFLAALWLRVFTREVAEVVWGILFQVYRRQQQG